MKILVTGGAGFIGSNLVDRLVNEGHVVTVIDNESASTNTTFYKNSNATYYKFDIAEYNNIRPLFENIDFVFHLAAEARIQPSIQNPLLAVRTNVLGTATVLQCAREAGVKKVIYSSTSSAYGLKNLPPLDENMPDDCLNPYSVSKVSGEKLVEMYHTLFGMNTVTLRYFNVYGPREPDNGPYAPVVRLFLMQKAQGNPLTIVGDGLQKRDFTHVNDVVNANILAMQTESSGLFNVGTGCNHSIYHLAQLISSDIVHIDPRTGEARETQANNNKIRNVMGWSPTIKLEDYIAEQLNKGQ